MTQRLRILVADEWQTWRDFFEYILKEHEVITANDVQDAVDKLENYSPPFHVLVTDIQFTETPHYDLKLGKHTLLETIAEKELYTNPVIVIPDGISWEESKEVLRNYNIHLWYCWEKNPGGDKNFNCSGFRDAVENAAGGALEARQESKQMPKGGRDSVAQQYIDLEIHVGLNGHARVKSDEGEEDEALSLEVPNETQLALEVIKHRNTNDKLLKTLGKQLYEIIFSGDIHTHLNQTEAAARGRGQKIRIRLSIEPDPLARLPWEFTYREKTGSYLAVDPKTVLSRYLNLSLPQGRVGERGRPLHLLLVISNPQDQRPLDPDKWDEIVRNALAVPVKNERLTISTVKHATFKQIRHSILEQPPDIVQFVCHGAYHEGKGYLALVDSETDGTWLVDDERFANIFLATDDNLGLVGLATCESAKSDSPQGFLGVAPKLVQRGVPAVVAMQYAVQVSTAEIFLENFYEAVASRKPIDWAIQWARNAISIQKGLDNREFATPVLYMRAKDGKVF
jgi:CHAT domain-containing protein